MTDWTYRAGIAFLLAVYAVLVVLVAAVVGFGLLGFGEEPPAMDDLHVSNAGEENYTVRLEVVDANDSTTTFDRTVRLAPGERRSFDGVTEFGRQYRLRVAVDGRAPEAFEVEGPDDRCTTEVRIDPNATAEESNASVDVGMGCA